MRDREVAGSGGVSEDHSANCKFRQTLKAALHNMIIMAVELEATAALHHLASCCVYKRSGSAAAAITIGLVQVHLTPRSPTKYKKEMWMPASTSLYIHIIFAGDVPQNGRRLLRLLQLFRRNQQINKLRNLGGHDLRI
jgi:hypothetical protein